MKVAMVTPFPLAPGRVHGGVEGAASCLASELAKLPGVELSVVVPQGAPGAKLARERWGSVAVHRLPKRGPWKLAPGTLYDLAAGSRQLARYLDGLAPDVVHFQGTSYLAARCARPSVLTVHGIAERDARWDARAAPGRWLKRALLGATEGYGRRAAPNVILISEAARAFIPEAPGRRFWSISNPVPDPFFSVARRPSRGRIFLCSRLTPLKNVHGMIEAFARLSRRVRGAQLRVAGDGDAAYLEECRTRALRRGVSASVYFLGALSPEAVREELSRAACFALPSFQENAPLALAEAMAAGVPSVAARVGGVPEMVLHRETGLLVDPSDERALADGVRALLEDPALAADLGRRSAELARERYRASDVARRTSEVYRQIVEGA